jgi:hypothetical protein
MQPDPYKPPTARVADVEPPLPIDRPFNVTWGIRFLWLELVISLPGFFETFAKPAEQTDRTVQTFVMAFVAVIVASMLVMGWVTVMAWKGRNWARITHLLVLLVGAAVSLLVMPSMSDESPPYDVAYLLQSALNVVGVGLLFTPPANAWYRALRR